jgi:hypothetical protein
MAVAAMRLMLLRTRRSFLVQAASSAAHRDTRGVEMHGLATYRGLGALFRPPIVVPGNVFEPRSTAQDVAGLKFVARGNNLAKKII